MLDPADGESGEFGGARRGVQVSAGQRREIPASGRDMRMGAGERSAGSCATAGRRWTDVEVGSLALDHLGSL
ncbi:hypothetical protein GCM10010411_13320 [Actinomadura fulvescens]|uniref:Uncharacterized protein n=1 Tax=Actinomadura fulvescens TaxID=46160 RepID=A0ABP6BQB6_9ACTN